MLSDFRINELSRETYPKDAREALLELLIRRKLQPFVRHNIYCQIELNKTCTCGLEAIQKELEYYYVNR